MNGEAKHFKREANGAGAQQSCFEPLKGEDEGNECFKTYRQYDSGRETVCMELSRDSVSDTTIRQRYTK